MTNIEQIEQSEQSNFLLKRIENKDTKNCANLLKEYADEELIKRNIPTLYILQENDIRLTDPKLKKVYSKLNLKTIKKAKEIKSIIKKDDILITRFDYKRIESEVIIAAKSMSAITFTYDTSGIDIRVRAAPSHFLFAKSQTLKNATEKKFPKHYKKIFVTGNLHCDSAINTQVNKKEFMESYGLDPNKKLVILLPANPGELGHQLGIDETYRNIVNIIKNQCPEYEIMIKAHPLDYTANMKSQPGIIHKNEHYKGKCSWEIFAPGIKVVKAEEGYLAIKACDALLNVRSSIAMETALLQKPLINIDRKKYVTNWPFDSKIMIDIDLSDLANVLNNNKYEIPDIKACKAYCIKENGFYDGTSYVRIANIIESKYKS